LHRFVTVVLVACFLLTGLVVGRTVNAQTSDARQFAPVALSADDVPGFQVISEQDVPVKSNDAIASAWQRVLSADDGAASGGAALSVLLMLPNPALSVDVLKSIVNTGGAFSSVTGATNLHLTGALGIGDVDQSATWQEWDSSDSTWDAFYADEFLSGRTIAAVIYGSHSDSVDPTRIVTLAQRQARLLATATLPTATPSAVPQPSATPTQQPVLTATPEPQPTATATPQILVPPTSDLQPGATATPASQPAATATPDALPSATPTPTSTPQQ
jgi:hypothetical protein